MPKVDPALYTTTMLIPAIYANDGQGYFDSIAYHPYTYVSGPDYSHWTFNELQSIVDLMNGKGDTDRKIWATEMGWATGTGEGEISEFMQSVFTGQAFDQWFGLPYAGPVLWYEPVDNNSYGPYRVNTFGLLHSSETQDWSAKPAYDRPNAGRNGPRQGSTAVVLNSDGTVQQVPMYVTKRDSNN